MMLVDREAKVKEETQQYLTIKAIHRLCGESRTTFVTNSLLKLIVTELSTKCILTSYWYGYHDV